MSKNRKKSNVDSTKYHTVLKPKTDNQEEYIRAMSETDMVFCIGPAGSGKTACAVGLAMEYLKEKKIEKIVVTRPTIGTDEDGWDKGLGYLPGDIRDKMDPYLRPIFDEMLKYIDKPILERMYTQGKIEIAPLTYMRGRTFHNAFVILDEAQNATFKQILMVCTRIGTNSKLVLNGDLDQHDRRGEECPFEVWVDQIIGPNSERISVVELEEQDIIRHPLVREILSKVENFEKSL